MDWICDKCGKKIRPYRLLCPKCERWLEETAKKERCETSGNIDYSENEENQETCEDGQRQD